MLQPLTLGNKTFPLNLIQGPLAGISCAPFRYLTWIHGQPAFSCTEMISCKTLMYQSERAAYQRYIAKDPQEGPVCYQLSSNNPQELAEATKIVTDHGADLIDLNCGCPVNKIRRRGAGSSLLSDASKLHQLIVAMKQNTPVPVSIKIRVEGENSDQCNQEIAKAVTDAGADFLVVHGRHWTEHYETPCRHDQIEFFVNELSIPVIGNGDITCLSSLKIMFATGCAGVMIGRAGVGQPWLIRQLAAEWQAQPFTQPEPSTIGAIFFEHVQRLNDLLGNEKFAILQARKFAKYYARTLPTRSDFCAKMNTCETLKTLETLISEYF